MKKISTRFGILIIIAAVVVLVGGTGAYLWYANSKLQITNYKQIQNLNTQNGNVDSSAKDLSIEDWKTYRNDEYGFEVKYPSNWAARNNTQDKDILIQFIAPNTEVLMENNTRACSDKNENTECSPDGVPADIILNISAKFTFSITEPQGTVYFSNIVFTKYLGAFAGEQHFITTHNNQDFDFTCINMNACNQILSTFKFTQ